MEVIVLGEYGHEFAAMGMSLSFKDRAIPMTEWWTKSRYEKISKTLASNAGRGLGHDKFLRQIAVYLSVEAPRYWWSEFDTYKVSTVAQSESTMHTLMRRDMDVYDLEQGIEQDIQQEEVGLFNKAKGRYINSIGEMKKYLPESYLQRRVVTLNYAVLRCIIEQRKNHKLPEWHMFIDNVYAQCEHPELLPKRD
jgi:hypothetical protein